MLKAIELVGFKSFAKKHVLEFSTPVTAIVGPNGSGKSNVAEAFRFVLGEQSVKTMRGKRGEDLIFGGSPELPRLNRASVAITFDNSRKILNCDYDEVTIRRTVHRDGVNEYSINDTTVRLKDIVELLASAHVGTTGHHMISQGEADRILSASPAERKEMIEDALGLFTFQLKKEEAERNIVKAEQHIGELESLRRELAPHVRFLKKQMQAIEQAESTRLELASTYQKYFALGFARANTQKAEYAAKKATLDEQLKKAAHTQQQLKKQRDDIQEAMNAFTERRKTHEQAVGSARRVVEELERTVSRIDGQIESLERISQPAVSPVSTVLRVERAPLVSALASIREAATSALDKLSDQAFCQQAFTGIVQTVSRYENTIEEKRESVTVADHRQAIDALREQRTGLASQITHAQTKLVEAEKELQNFDATHQSEVAQLGSITESYYSASSEHERAVRDLEHLQVLIHDQENFKQQLDRELIEARHVAGKEAVMYEQAQLDATDFAEVHRNVERLRIRYETHNVGDAGSVMKEYQETVERDTALEKELVDVQATVEHLQTVIAELSKTLSTRFHDGLKLVSTQFDEFFKLVFGGGSGSVKLVKEPKRRRGDEAEDAPQEFVDGVVVDVELPRKKIRGLDVLSGGERALTSIALLFSLSQINPPPFMVLDETDAALDEANSKRYGDMIDLLAKHSQLILVTHNRETMSRAGVLYGVTMSKDGSSRLLSIKFDEAVKVAK